MEDENVEPLPYAVHEEEDDGRPVYVLEDRAARSQAWVAPGLGFNAYRFSVEPDAHEVGIIEPPPTLESNIPAELPALARAQKVYERARRKGIALEDGAIAPLVKQLGRGRSRERGLGELLFGLAAWAEANGLDATSALREATRRFAEQNAKVKEQRG